MVKKQEGEQSQFSAIPAPADHNQKWYCFRYEKRKGEWAGECVVMNSQGAMTSLVKRYKQEIGIDAVGPFLWTESTEVDKGNRMPKVPEYGNRNDYKG